MKSRLIFSETLSVCIQWRGTIGEIFCDERASGDGVGKTVQGRED